MEQCSTMSRRTLRLKVVHLPLLLSWLLLRLDLCESLVDISLPEIFYPFGSDEGDSVVTPGTNCQGPINIPYEFFNYRTLYVCTSGTVSFATPLTTTIRSIPRSSGPPFIAANWNGFRYYASHYYNKGRVYYRSTSTDTSLLEATSRTVRQVFRCEGFSEFQSRWAFIATWHNVSVYYTITARYRPDSFQMAISTNGSEHFVILNYGKLYSSSTGTAGYDSRQTGDYHRLISSQRLSGTNAGIIGRWAFHINRVLVRLAGSSLRQEGRLEVKYNGVWGTVTKDSFTSDDAKVICCTLGFGYNGQVLDTKYGPGSGRIWLDNVNCTGNETSIDQCGHRGWGVHDNTHADDVSISCYFDSATEYAVRLVNGQNPGEGRVELLQNGTWGTICDDGFYSASARVICKMLGFGYVGRYIGGYTARLNYGPGTGQIWLSYVGCRGTETDVGQCPHRGWGVNRGCSHYEDVAVICSRNPTSVPLRLVGTDPASREGRLEVFYSGAWGTVCDHSFSNISAQVACNILGFGYVGHVLSNVHVAGTGSILLDNVQCRGCEASLDECPHSPWRTHSCHHGEDVSIACYDQNATTHSVTTPSETGTEGPTSSHTTSPPNDTTLIIIVVVVVGGLIVIAFITCIIVIICTSYRKQRKQSLQDGMPATDPSNRHNVYNDVAYINGNVQQSSAHPVAGVFGDRDTNYEQPSDYEWMPDDQDNSRVVMRRNSPHRSIINRARDSIMPT